MWTVETVSHVGPEAWTGLGTVVLSQVRCREGKSECGLECGLASTGCAFL